MDSISFAETWKYPIERTYSPEKAYESYKRLSAKHTKHAKPIQHDLETAKRIAEENRTHWQKWKDSV